MPAEKWGCTKFSGCKPFATGSVEVGSILAPRSTGIGSVVLLWVESPALAQEVQVLSASLNFQYGESNPVQVSLRRNFQYGESNPGLVRERHQCYRYTILDMFKCAGGFLPVTIPSLFSVPQGRVG
ncbi:hypothetical protein B0H14DRAFT_2620054 [Mycena olivaceomarginata]|nr:hypothetical protein B0H14DRAFT_2620054 [Mycena olivaceomarginata]